MFYRQSLQNIKVVVLTLDGGLLDLNHLRFNYLKKQGKNNNQDISLEQFESFEGNYSNMYDFLSFDFNPEPMERDLFEYVKYNPGIVKSGVEELLKFLKLKGIMVAVYTTYKAKRAIQYLQLCRLDQYVDYVIGGDSECQALPSNQIIDLMIMKFGVVKEEMLVVANFKSMVLAANQSYTNVVYMPDLVEPTLSIERMVYRLVHNCFEIINLFLFDRFDDVSMYGEVLNLSEAMDETELEHTYNSLVREYGDDTELLRLVRQTYFYFLGELQNRHFEEFAKDRLDKAEYPQLDKGLLFDAHDQEMDKFKYKLGDTYALDLTKLEATREAARKGDKLDFDDFRNFGEMPNFIKDTATTVTEEAAPAHAINLDFTTEIPKEEPIKMDLEKEAVALDKGADWERIQMISKSGKFAAEDFSNLHQPLADSTAEIPTVEESLGDHVLDQVVKNSREADPDVTQNQKDTLDMINALATREIDKKELQVAQPRDLGYSDEFYMAKGGFISLHKRIFYPLIFTVIGFGLYYFSGAPFDNLTGFLEILDSILDFYVDGVVALYATLFNFINGHLAFVPSYDSLMAWQYYDALLFVFYLIFNIIIFDFFYTLFKFVLGKN